ncbi:MAG: glycosyltransferase family 1 protein [Alphaproteobacteria bacterium]|nr:glycosyltransferase family 1 protein [Alphaproteobacteria bacterium]
MNARVAARDVLIATWEGGGSVPPALAVATRLIARGHRVRVMSDEANRREAEAVGAEFVAWRRAPSRPDKSPESDFVRDWEAATPMDGIRRLFDRIMFGPALAYARDLMDELARRPADVVATSEMLFGAMIGAEAARVPLAIVGTTVSIWPIPGIPPLGPGLLPARSEAERAEQAAMARGLVAMLDEGLPALNDARAALGLSRVASVVDVVDRAARVLQGIAAAFDFPAAMLPANFRYVGPLVDEIGTAEPWISPWPADDARKLVVVSFSTTYQGQMPAFQRTLDALAGLPARGLATVGPAIDGDELRVPANCIVRRTVRHTDVMRGAAAVVTHCGHGTTARALVSGVPVLCMPMGRDQADIAARVVARGAGLQVAADAAPQVIAAALRRLLDEPYFGAAARRLGEAMRAEIAASPLVAELEALAASRDQPAVMRCPSAA